MTTGPSVVGISGSRRRPSYTNAAVELALDGAGEVAASTTHLDLGSPDHELPLYHPDRDPTGDLRNFMAAVRDAQGVILGTPVYHGSYSSALKSFHDWCGFDEFERTAVGLVAVAGGGTYGTTLAHLRDTVRGVHGLVVPEQVGIRNASDRFDGDRLTHDGLRERTLEVGRAVAEEANRRDQER